MKQTLYIVFFMCVTVITVAQPVPSANMPAAGEQFGMYSSTTPIPAPSGGANQTWDYSTNNKSALYNYTWVNVAGLSQDIKDSFPGATHATELRIGTAVASTDMYKVTSGALINMGSKGSGSSWNINRPERTIFNIPMNLGDTFGNKLTSAIRDVLTYDAYGTLKTPFGTYTDVIRFKTEQTGMADKFYIYYQCSPTFKKLCHYVIDNTGASKNVFFYDVISSGTGINDLMQTNSFSVYPNPVKSGTTVNLKGIPAGKTNIELMNLSGKIVSKSAAGALTISTEGLQAGIYILRFTTAANVIMQKLVVE